MELQKQKLKFFGCKLKKQSIKSEKVPETSEDQNKIQTK